MATAKTKFVRMKQTAERLDWLHDNARVLRSPALWERYYEAKHITELLGFQVKMHEGHHEVTPC
ncbi:MAG: hypothetical protein SPF64_03185 [Faecalibacterium longum]|nr:hypothetical protein [Faecalibacterium prausnitzii]MDY5549336.1 hypothetical protein [Faecalibacterium longum]